jgi:hypothetical protein
LLDFWSFIAALVVTFWLAWLLARVTPLGRLRGIGGTIAVHLVSGTVLFIALGLFKAYFTSFNEDEAMIILPAQLVWLLADLGLGGIARTGSRRAG